MINISTEEEIRERRKRGKEVGDLINEIKPFVNSIDSEIIGTHLYEVGYRKVEDYKKEIERLKEKISSLEELKSWVIKNT